jgi:hypothetical protein
VISLNEPAHSDRPNRRPHALVRNFEPPPTINPAGQLDALRWRPPPATTPVTQAQCQPVFERLRELGFLFDPPHIIKILLPRHTPSPQVSESVREGCVRACVCVFLAATIPTQRSLATMLLEPLGSPCGTVVHLGDLLLTSGSSWIPACRLSDFEVRHSECAQNCVNLAIDY